MAESRESWPWETTELLVRPESLDITDTGIRYCLGHYELTDSRIWVGKLCRKLLLLLLLFFVLFLSDIYLENLIAIAILWGFPINFHVPLTNSSYHRFFNLMDVIDGCLDVCHRLAVTRVVMIGVDCTTKKHFSECCYFYFFLPSHDFPSIGGWLGRAPPPG